jgi:pimeloyl-ACP methyl ester carboxylesterase
MSPNLDATGPDPASPAKSSPATTLHASPLGDLSLLIKRQGDALPVVFLHGVFLDHTLWSAHDHAVTDRTRVYLDLPVHGASADVGRPWSLAECSDLLLRLLDQLALPRVIAIGHSWGAMTILRAASAHPSRFASVGLFNMPFRRTTGLRRLGFTLQKTFTRFPRFYARQAAKSLYSPGLLAARPDLVRAMEDRLAVRPARELARVIDAVILDAADTSRLAANLSVPALAVVGRADYVGIPPGIETFTVPSGHISPHEAPQETALAIQRVLALAQNPATSNTPPS